MSNSTAPIRLSLPASPEFARLVRMTAANVAALSHMSVDRIEDMRMAAEEAFICASSVDPDGELAVTFSVGEEGVSMDFELSIDSFPPFSEGDPAAYADLLLGAVCDGYEKLESPARLTLDIRADV